MHLITFKLRRRISAKFRRPAHRCAFTFLHLSGIELTPEEMEFALAMIYDEYSVPQVPEFGAPSYDGNPRFQRALHKRVVLRMKDDQRAETMLQILSRNELYTLSECFNWLQSEYAPAEVMGPVGKALLLGDDLEWNSRYAARGPPFENDPSADDEAWAEAVMYLPWQEDYVVLQKEEESTPDEFTRELPEDVLRPTKRQALWKAAKGGDAESWTTDRCPDGQPNIVLFEFLCDAFSCGSDGSVTDDKSNCVHLEFACGDSRRSSMDSDLHDKTETPVMTETSVADFGLTRGTSHETCAAEVEHPVIVSSMKWKDMSLRGCLESNVPGGGGFAAWMCQLTDSSRCSQTAADDYVDVVLASIGETLLTIPFAPDSNNAADCNDMTGIGNRIRQHANSGTDPQRNLVNNSDDTASEVTTEPEIDVKVSRLNLPESVRIRISQQRAIRPRVRVSPQTAAASRVPGVSESVSVPRYCSTPVIRCSQSVGDPQLKLYPTLLDESQVFDTDDPCTCKALARLRAAWPRRRLPMPCV